VLGLIEVVVIEESIMRKAITRFAEKAMSEREVQEFAEVMEAVYENWRNEGPFWGLDELLNEIRVYDDEWRELGETEKSLLRTYMKLFV
jgi:hypothetical protein